MQRIRDIYFFVDTLIEKFQAHTGNNGKTAEMEPILGKMAPSMFRRCSDYEAYHALRPAFDRVRRAGPARVIEIDATGKRRDVVEQIVVVAHPRIETFV